MAGINFLGSYSGIDQSTIDKLMYYEKLPLRQLDARKSTISTQKDAWKDVNTRLNSLFNRLNDLKDPSTFNSMSAKVGSDRNILSATASKDAISGKYDIEVRELATNTRVMSNENPTITAGTFEIKNKEGSVAKVTIGDNDSLKDIANKINEASKNGVGEDGEKVNVGINATVINDRLVITDEKTGARSITFTDVTGNITSSLGLDNSDNINTGKQAGFTINGIDGKSDSNVLDDKVLGLTINLHKAEPGYKETITVGADTEKLTKAIQGFVDQYNSTLSFIKEQTAAGTVSTARNADGMYETTGRGALAGDNALRSLQDSLIRMVTDRMTGSAGIKDISQLGITTSSDRSGKLSFDSSKFKAELEKDPEAVQNFFNAEGSGFVEKLNIKIDRYISTKDGLIKNKNESLDRSLKDISDRIEVFNNRISRKEEYYKRQFTALDSAMMQAESQMEWLQGQIAAMNAQAKSK